MSTNKQYAKVENHPGYARDLDSTAIISNNNSAYNAFVADKQKKKEYEYRLDRLERSLDMILEKIDSISNSNL